MHTRARDILSTLPTALGARVYERLEIKMRNKKLNYFGMFLLLLSAFAFVPAKPCLAASAQVDLSSDSTQITVGDVAYVYVNISSDTSLGNFEANVTYDDNLLQYNSVASFITGDSGFLKISDMNETEGGLSRKYTLKFKALQVGICKISFSGPVMVYDLDTDQEMSVLSNDLTLDIKAPKTASTDAKLKSLEIRPQELTPAFDPGVFEYSMNVSNETEQLFITALPEDSKATVSISGNDFLKEGENKVIISVLAESGDVIEYTINVIRESAPSVAPTNTEGISPNNIKGSFDLIEADGTTYAVFSGKYIITQPDSRVSIPEGYQLSSLTISNITIQAYLPVNNEGSEFVLIYATNEFGDSGFYQYDRIEKTLQRYVPDNLIINSNSSLDATGNHSGDDHLTAAVVVIALLSGFCTIMIFVTIRMFFKLKGYKEDDLD